jgi:hypothetical protein
MAVQDKPCKRIVSAIFVRPLQKLIIPKTIQTELSPFSANIPVWVLGMLLSAEWCMNGIWAIQWTDCKLAEIEKNFWVRHPPILTVKQNSDPFMNYTLGIRDRTAYATPCLFSVTLRPIRWEKTLIFILPEMAELFSLRWKPTIGIPPATNTFPTAVRIPLTTVADTASMRQRRSYLYPMR